MKKGIIMALVIAALCMVAGLCIAAVAIVDIGHDFGKISAMQPQTNKHTITDEFSCIDIQTVEADISLLPAEDGICRVICEETDKITHTVTVEGNTLTVRRQDSRHWYEKINLFFPSLSITVYLPQEEYDALTLSGVSSDIEISAALCFGNTAFSSTSGSITSEAQISGNLTAATVSGNITLSKHTGGHLAVSTTSGEINLKELDASAITVTSVSGNIAMTDAAATGMLQAESVSGEIYLTRADGEGLTLSTVSGNINATLLSGKDFSHETVSGHVSLPSSTEGAGTCKLKTTSGNIRITVEGDE